MSIKDISEKIKLFGSNKVVPLISKVKGGLDLKEDIFIVLAIILIGLAGFGLGKLSSLEKNREPVEIKPANFINSVSTSTAGLNTDNKVQTPLSAAALISSETTKGMLVASKNGTKYHFPSCPGAAQISDKNKVWFNSYEEAQKAGYTPAANCKGLK